MTDDENLQFCADILRHVDGSHREDRGRAEPYSPEWSRGNVVCVPVVAGYVWRERVELTAKGRALLGRAS